MLVVEERNCGAAFAIAYVGPTYLLGEAMRQLPGVPAVAGVFLLMAAVSGVLSSAVAQGYPEKPVMLMVARAGPTGCARLKGHTEAIHGLIAVTRRYGQLSSIMTPFRYASAPFTIAARMRSAAAAGCASINIGVRTMPL